MRLSDMYPGAMTDPSQPAPPPNSTGGQMSPPPPPPPAAKSMPGAAAVSWIGILIALVLLRIVYEVSE